MDNSYFSLSKNEKENFDGALTIDNQLYTFENADLMHVAASVGVALNIGVEPISEQLKSKDLTKLGKSIDLLVKSQVVKKFKKKKLDKADSVVAKTPTLPPPPKAPAAPSLKLDKPPMAPSSPLKSFSPAGGSSKLKITKSESEKICEECGLTQFKEMKFIGCACLSALAQGIKVEKSEQDFVLHFDSSIDSDALETIVEILKE